MPTFPTEIESDLADVFAEALGALALLLVFLSPLIALARWREDPEVTEKVSLQLSRLRGATRRSIERDGVTLPRSTQTGPPLGLADAMRTLNRLALNLTQAVASAGEVESDLVDKSTTAAAGLARLTVTFTRSRLTRSLQEAAGVRTFRWITRQDDRVRPSHTRLPGKIFTWAEGAPVEGYPGEPWGCRCSAAPITTER